MKNSLELMIGALFPYKLMVKTFTTCCLFGFSFLHAQEKINLSNLGDVEKLGFESTSNSDYPTTKSLDNESLIKSESSTESETIYESDLSDIEPTVFDEKEANNAKAKNDSNSSTMKAEVEKVIIAQNFQQNTNPQYAPQPAGVPYPNPAPAQYNAPAPVGQYPSQTTGAGQYPAAYPPQAPVAPLAPPRPLAAIGSAESEYAFQSHRLSYMQSDRVLALLKALGYSTIEFSQGRGESINESIFSELAQPKKYPLIVKILDAAKTSLMQPSMDGGRNVMGVDRLSGTYLHQSTTGAPEQRLLIIYEKE